MKNTPITICLCLASSLVVAQEQKEVAKTDPNIRPAAEVLLKFEHKIKIPEIKRFRNGVLELFPGDTVHLQFEKKGGDLVSPKVVAKVEHPKRTITFKMTQDESITMLNRESAIQKTVAMDCEHKDLGSEEFFRTHLIPTEKGLMAGDSWPNTVWILRISNIEVTSRPATEVYTEKVSQGSRSDQGKREDGADQPATAPESKSEGKVKAKPKPESE